MPGNDTNVVRIPLRTRERSRRTLDQRLLVRFPRLAAALFRRAWILPPDSRLRRAALSRSVRLAAEAYNRRDLDVVVLGFGPELEYRPAQAWVEGGFFEPCYDGRDGYRRYVESTAEVFGGEVYFKPFELIALRDTAVVLATVPMRAQASGVPLTERFAYVWRLKDGRLVRIEEYYDYDEALRAAGIAEPATASTPSRTPSRTGSPPPA